MKIISMQRSRETIIKTLDYRLPSIRIAMKFAKYHGLGNDWINERLKSRVFSAGFFVSDRLENSRM